MRVVVTRAAHQAEELAAPLRALGAEVISLPMIGIAPPLDEEPIEKSARHANDYDWIVFTSANGVSAFGGRLEISPAELKARIAVVGAATRSVAEKCGFTVAVTPARYVAEALVDALGEKQLTGKRVLIPAADIARDVVPAELRRRGAQVDVVEAYRNILPTEAESLAHEIFRPPYPDWVTFASPSAVDNLVALIGVDELRHSKLASIGRVTSAAIRRYELDVAAEADPHTVDGLVRAVIPYSASGTSTQ